MRPSSIIGIFLVILVGSLAASTSQEIIPLTSTIYEDMDTLYLASRLGTPSRARPWTKNEARKILSRVTRENQTQVIQRLYDSIESLIASDLPFAYSDEFQFDIDLTLNLEMYWHTNTSEFVKDTDWIYGFEERKPLVKIDLEFALENIFYVGTNLQYGRNRYAPEDMFLEVGGDSGVTIGSTIDEDMEKGRILEHSSIYSQSILTNMLYPTYNLDMQIPKRAVASVGGKHWNFSLSRDRIQWGNGKSGNFIIDDHVDYHEFSRFTVFTDSFKYDWLNVFFETNPSMEESTSSDTEFRMLMAHRLEFRLSPRIVLAISENVMYRNSVFNFRYVNPAFIYHNLNSSNMFNAIAHMEIDFILGNTTRLYGQFVLDQAVAPHEPSHQPDAFGFLSGVEHAWILSKGIFSSSLEFALTSPAMYQRENVDFLFFRKYHGNGTKRVSHIDYIGYPYGGDVQVLQIDSSYNMPQFGSVGVTIIGLQHGGVNIFTPNSEVQSNYENTPSGGEVYESGVVSLWADISPPSMTIFGAQLGLWGQLDWVGKRIFVKPGQSQGGYYKNMKQDFQINLGVSLAF